MGSRAPAGFAPKCLNWMHLAFPADISGHSPSTVSLQGNYALTWLLHSPYLCFFFFQISMSVQPRCTTVMPTQCVSTCRDYTAVTASQDTSAWMTSLVRVSVKTSSCFAKSLLLCAILTSSRYVLRHRVPRFTYSISPYLTSISSFEKE